MENTINNDNDNNNDNDFIIINNTSDSSPNSKISEISRIYLNTLSAITSMYNKTLTSISNNNIYESSENTKISMTNSPWPVINRPSSCYICNYYGHDAANGPNITESVANKCIRCFSIHHLSNNCPNKEQSPIPFKKNYKPPKDFL